MTQPTLCLHEASSVWLFLHSGPLQWFLSLSLTLHPFFSQPTTTTTTTPPPPSEDKLWLGPDIPSNLLSQHRVKRARVLQRKPLCATVAVPEETWHTTAQGFHVVNALKTIKRREKYTEYEFWMVIKGLHIPNLHKCMVYWTSDTINDLDFILTRLTLSCVALTSFLLLLYLLFSFFFYFIMFFAKQLNLKCEIWQHTCLEHQRQGAKLYSCSCPVSFKVKKLYQLISNVSSCYIHYMNMDVHTCLFRCSTPLSLQAAPCKGALVITVFALPLGCSSDVRATWARSLPEESFSLLSKMHYEELVT